MMNLSHQQIARHIEPARFDSASPAFLITIDTEGDNLWSRPRHITTENARYLYRFQTLCERWEMKPTYLVDYDMANSVEFVNFGHGVIQRSAAEIGMHLHAWSTPPEFKLTKDDLEHQPFLIEYPEPLIRDKVAFMTELLEKTFGIPMRSHRAGRWALNETYARVLLENGYFVDCTVTPNINWESHLGDPLGQGGSNYRSFPDRAYFVDLDDISRPGPSGLLEIPMSIQPCRSDVVRRIRQRYGERAWVSRLLNRFIPRYTWFRPRNGNLGEMLGVLKWVKREKINYVEFILHSSEFMPGQSPTFKNGADIEALYESLETLFEKATSTAFRGATLTEFYMQHGSHCSERDVNEITSVDA